ncbi:MAG: hypothetical protein IPL71_20845 [Anaerolineales bacterium]|uniref:hypothetical protein n=1 Tax=Candidatus Villigracilis proximus TaxID=3140683 RepID=UPI003135BD59|nr:hypothetical protein [Anaerolineales bacterium]
MKAGTYIHEKAALASCVELADGSMNITLDNGDTFVVDEIILATGYKVDLNQIPFLDKNLLSEISTRNGFLFSMNIFKPVRGLYFKHACRSDFGPFFGFTISVRASAQIIGNAIAGR